METNAKIKPLNKQETLEEVAERYGKQVLDERKSKNLSIDEEIWLSGGSIVGFIDGAKWQQDMADKWISVEDRLPEESGRYLGYLKGLKDLGNSFSIINVAFNTNHKDSTAWTEHGEVLQYITHWMPLPNKPLNKQD